MPDNTTLPGTGNVIATDDVGGVHYQIIKQAFGALDTATLVSAANPFPTVELAGALVSTANSSAVNIAAAGTFVGASEDISSYAHVSVAIFTSHVSATDGLQIQQSTDGTNWEFGDSFSVPAATGKVFSAPVQARFFRISYTNGATLTTAFRLQVIFSKQQKKGSTIKAGDARSVDNDFDEMVAYGALFNGTSWDRARGMSVSTTTGDTGAKTLSGSGASVTNVGNKGAQVVIVLGAVTGTTPTAVFKLQSSVDSGTTWVDIPGAATASLTAAGNFGVSVYPGQAVTAGTTTSNTTATANGVLSRVWRVVWTIGGTLPSFPITSITYNYLPN